MHFKTQLEHLTRLCSAEGFKAHCWRRAKELEDADAMFKGMPEALKSAVTGQAKDSESDRQSATKPRSPGRKSGS